MTQQATAIQPAIPFKRGSETDSVLASSGAGILALSIIAIVVMLVMRKRLRLGMLQASRKPMLQVLETRRLGPRALVSVIEFNGTHYLLAQSEQGVACIASVPVEERQ